MVVAVFDFRDLVLFLEDLLFSPVYVQVFQLISSIKVCRVSLLYVLLVDFQLTALNPFLNCTLIAA
jgi:hypothetical protein